MASIHRAAGAGNLATLNRLLGQDPDRLNPQDARGHTPLMFAARQGRDAVVARLLALGAATELQDDKGRTATHWACICNCTTSVALLLNAGVSIMARTQLRGTPLMAAASAGSVDCVALLLARGGDGLDVMDTVRTGVNGDGSTALHLAAYEDHPEIVALLLQAGADPTIRANDGFAPLDDARAEGHQQCIALLEGALAEPQRARTLLKARTLLDASCAIDTAHANARDKQGLPRAGQQRAALAASPLYLKQRVTEGLDLQHAEVEEGGNEKVTACIKYAIGLEGGGAVVLEGQGPAVGMVKEVFVELCEMLVSKLDRANM